MVVCSAWAAIGIHATETSPPPEQQLARPQACEPTAAVRGGTQPERSGLSRGPDGPAYVVQPRLGAWLARAPHPSIADLQTSAAPRAGYRETHDGGVPEQRSQTRVILGARLAECGPDERLVGIERSSYAYASRRAERAAPVRAGLRAVAGERPWWGVARLHWRLWRRADSAVV